MSTESNRPTDLPSPRTGGPRQQPVVVGVDGSPGSRAALVYALAEAARRGARLEVVSTRPTTLPWTGGSPIDVPSIYDVLRDTRARTSSFVDEVRSDPTVEAIAGAREVSVRIVPVAGAAAETLVAHSRDAQLLVVGSRGRSAVRSALLGSVALHCVTHAKCPVVVVHQPPTGIPAGAPVVVGVDGSDESLAALRVAVEEAVRRHTDLAVLAAYLLSNFWVNLYSIAEPSIVAIRSLVFERATEMVEQVLGEWPVDRRPGVTIAPLEGPAEDVLVEHACDAALLVVGSRGRGTLRGLLLGSIALHCVMHASCPVLVGHPRTARISPEVSPLPSAVASG